MKPAVPLVCLVAVSLFGCSLLPRSGPPASAVAEQGQVEGEILFDVVDVNDRVVSTLLAQPKVSFATRFNEEAEPPDIKIAVGDTISVVIWESAAGGLFTETPPSAPGPTRSTTEPLEPESPSPTVQRPNDQGAFGPNPQAGGQRRGNPEKEALPIEASAASSGRQPTEIPNQQVGADGAISIPYAGRIPAAGRSPLEVQQSIERRLAEKALQPQALVIVTKSAANSVTVTGEARELTATAAAGTTTAAAGTTAATGVPLLAVAAAATGTGAPASAGAAAATGAPVSGGSTATTAVSPLSPGGAVTPAVSGFGARVPLSPGGDRLLQVIAAAGGGKTPVYETFIRLSRGGVTATLPIATLVSDPAENIYAQPGDVLTLVRIPQTFSVFGAAGRNADIPFDADKLTLSEALAKSQGLNDDLANPRGVFLFRYESNSTVRALDQPIASRSPDGRSPIAYRFDFNDAKSNFLAHQFPLHDKDIIFVADAGAVQVQKLFALLATVTGPIVSGIVVCRQVTC